MKEKNARRFTGFAGLYEKARPSVPQEPVRLVCDYLGRAPDAVVDLGCGTGLSTRAWLPVAGQIVGVDPSADMLAVARAKSAANLRFVEAFSDDTGLPDGFADAVVCSQSFHWMEPSATLREVDRILKPGGVFAAIDCDWPPVTLWQAEQAYMALYGKVRALERAEPALRETFVRYDKDRHLANIRASGVFRYARELLFSHEEPCTAERLIGLLLSQGSVQTVLRLMPERIEDDLRAFSDTVRGLFGTREFTVRFCYRMRVGIK